MNEQSLGDRIKSNYENRAKSYLTRRTPVIIRLDGCHFSSFTKGFSKPFDPIIISSMVNAAKKTAKEMQGFQFAYIQSDEAQFFLRDYAELNSEAWFDYSVNKIVSVSASLMTANFNQSISNACPNIMKLATFDGRAFNIPKEEVVNSFLFRALDYERNSLSMYCQSIFSHKDLMNKNGPAKHEMLHSVGKNWTTDCSEQERNGTFLIRTENGIIERTDILPNYNDIAKVLDLLVYPLTKIEVK